MICDDEHLIAESVERLLKKVGDKKKINLDIKISKNGIECLYQIYNEAIAGRKIDLLLIDENMPFMIGSECIRILRNLMTDKRIAKFKIYSITGYVDSDHVNYIKTSGSDGFYSKPISLNMMQDLLIKAEILNKKNK
jgi:CheY-like chemotaxis protein